MTLFLLIRFSDEQRRLKDLQKQQDVMQKLRVCIVEKIFFVAKYLS
jgi:hypothetical protein